MKCNNREIKLGFVLSVLILMTVTAPERLLAGSQAVGGALWHDGVPGADFELRMQPVPGAEAEPGSIPPPYSGYAATYESGERIGNITWGVWEEPNWMLQHPFNTVGRLKTQYSGRGSGCAISSHVVLSCAHVFSRDPRQELARIIADDINLNVFRQAGGFTDEYEDLEAEILQLRGLDDDEIGNIDWNDLMQDAGITNPVQQQAFNNSVADYEDFLLQWNDFDQVYPGDPGWNTVGNEERYTWRLQDNPDFFDNGIPVQARTIRVLGGYDRFYSANADNYNRIVQRSSEISNDAFSTDIACLIFYGPVRSYEIPEGRPKIASDSESIVAPSFYWPWEDHPRYQTLGYPSDLYRRNNINRDVMHCLGGYPAGVTAGFKSVTEPSGRNKRFWRIRGIDSDGGHSGGPVFRIDRTGSWSSPELIAVHVAGEASGAPFAGWAKIDNEVRSTLIDPALLETRNDDETRFHRELTHYAQRTVNNNTVFVPDNSPAVLAPLDFRADLLLRTRDLHALPGAPDADGGGVWPVYDLYEGEIGQPSNPVVLKEFAYGRSANEHDDKYNGTVVEASTQDKNLKVTRGGDFWMQFWRWDNAGALRELARTGPYTLTVDPVITDFDIGGIGSADTGGARRIALGSPVEVNVTYGGPAVGDEVRIVVTRTPPSGNPQVVPAPVVVSDQTFEAPNIPYDEFYEYSFSQTASESLNGTWEVTVSSGGRGDTSGSIDVEVISYMDWLQQPAGGVLTVPETGGAGLTAQAYSGRGTGLEIVWEKASSSASEATRDWTDTGERGERFEIDNALPALHDGLYRAVAKLKDGGEVIDEIVTNVTEIQVVPNPLIAPPVITLQPEGGDIPLGGNATMEIIATGDGTLHFQWYKNGVPIDHSRARYTKFSGELSTFEPIITDPTAAFGAVPEQSGVYQVAVTNSGGTTVSEAVPINVVVPEILPATGSLTLERYGDRTFLRWNPVEGATGYRIETSDSGEDGSWAEWVGNGDPGTTGPGLTWLEIDRLDPYIRIAAVDGVLAGLYTGISDTVGNPSSLRDWAVETVGTDFDEIGFLAGDAFGGISMAGSTPAFPFNPGFGYRDAAGDFSYLGTYPDDVLSSPNAIVDALDGLGTESVYLVDRENGKSLEVVTFSPEGQRTIAFTWNAELLAAGARFEESGFARGGPADDSLLVYGQLSDGSWRFAMLDGDYNLLEEASAPAQGVSPQLCHAIWTGQDEIFFSALHDDGGPVLDLYKLDSARTLSGLATLTGATGTHDAPYEVDCRGLVEIEDGSVLALFSHVAFLTVSPRRDFFVSTYRHSDDITEVGTIFSDTKQFHDTLQHARARQGFEWKYVGPMETFVDLSDLGEQGDKRYVFEQRELPAKLLLAYNVGRRNASEIRYAEISFPSGEDPSVSGPETFASDIHPDDYLELNDMVIDKYGVPLLLVTRHIETPASSEGMLIDPSDGSTVSTYDDPNEDFTRFRQVLYDPDGHLFISTRGTDGPDKLLSYGIRYIHGLVIDATPRQPWVESGVFTVDKADVPDGFNQAGSFLFRGASGGTVSVVGEASDLQQGDIVSLDSPVTLEFTPDEDFPIGMEVLLTAVAQENSPEVFQSQSLSLDFSGDDVPGGLILTIVNGTIRVAWNPVPEATGYRVTATHLEDDPSLPIEQSVTDPFIELDESLFADGTWEFRVWAQRDTTLSPPAPETVSFEKGKDSDLVAEFEPAAEGENIEIEFVLTRPGTEPIEISFRSASASATAGEDFVPVSGSVVFAAGEIRKDIVIETLTDAVDEKTEVLELVVTRNGERTGFSIFPEIEGELGGFAEIPAPPKPIISGNLNFPPTAPGEVSTRVLEITNEGDQNLSLYGLELPDGFASGWAGELAPGESANVNVRFLPQSEGAYGGPANLYGDFEGSMEFTVSGTTTEPPRPEIVVSGAGLVISAGDATPRAADGTDFGGVEVGETVLRTFRVSNAGDASLFVSASSDNGLFRISGLSSPILAGEFDDFTVTYEPSAAGTHTATIRIENNDADENPFEFTVSGVGVEPSGPSWARPSGWHWTQGEWEWSNDGQFWYWIPPGPPSVLNTATNQVVARPVNGWNFYAWPYFWNADQGVWYYIFQGNLPFVLNPATNQWRRWGD